jgi:hypothetical protein
LEEGTLLRVQKKTRITEDSESSARRALSKCISAQEGTELLKCSVEKILRQEGVEKVCSRHREKRTL